MKMQHRVIVGCALVLSILMLSFVSNTPPAFADGGWTPPALPGDYTPLDSNVWPDASNTGVPAGTALTQVYGPAQSDSVNGHSRMPYGPVVITQDNAVIENQEIYGGLDIRAKNVVVHNCRITSNFEYQGMEDVNGTGVVVIESGASATIERCTLDGSVGTHAGIWHMGEGMVAVGNNIFNVNDGIFSWQTVGTTEGNNFVIQDNYLHDFTEQTANGHIDGYQTEGCKDGIIRHNSFDVNFAGNACVAIWDSLGDSGNILVENNLFAGSGYAVYCEDYSPSEASPAGGYGVTGIRFLNNAFSTKYYPKCGYWGAWYPFGPTDGWNNAPDSGMSYRAGNYCLETGQNVDSGNPGDIILPPPGAGEWYCTGDADFPGGEHPLGTENKGIVTTEFDITPKADNADSGVGYTDSDTEAAGWSSLPVIFKLNSTGFFDCRNGGAYPLDDLPPDTPAEQLPPTAMRYAANSTYHVRLVIDLNAQLYDAYVTPLDGSGNPTGNPFMVAKGYAFRTGAPAMDDVGKCYTAPGTANAYIVSGHMVVPAAFAVGPTDNTSARKLGTKNTGYTGGNTVVAKFDILPRSTACEFALGYLDSDNDFSTPSSGYSAFSRWNMLMLFSPNADGSGGGSLGSIVVRDGGAYAQLNPFAFVAGTKYHMKLVTNLNARTYSVWIEPEGGSAVQLAQDYAYRTNSPAIDDLGTVAAFSDYYAAGLDLMQVTNHTVMDNSNFTAAIAAVNAAQTTDEMSSALLSSALGLSLDGYFQAPAGIRDAVIDAVLTGKGAGYADDLDIQKALDMSVADTLRTHTVPTDVTAASVSYTSVKVSWGEVPGVAGYEIWQSASKKGTYSCIGTTLETSFLNTGLHTGRPYYYKVRSYSMSGSATIYSNFSVVVTGRAVPAAPGNLKADSAGRKSIRLAWNAVAGATRYEVWRSTAAGGKYCRVATLSSAGYTDKGLKTGRIYYYKVRAYHMEGCVKVYGIFSGVVSAKP